VELALVDIVIKVADGAEIIQSKLQSTVAAVVGHLQGKMLVQAGDR